jgi:hypothetical protein
MRPAAEFGGGGAVDAEDKEGDRAVNWKVGSELVQMVAFSAMAFITGGVDMDTGAPFLLGIGTALSFVRAVQIYYGDGR